MFRASDADFGFLTTEADMKAKNGLRAGPELSGPGTSIPAFKGLVQSIFFGEGLAVSGSAHAVFQSELAVPTKEQTGGVLH